jgi:sortase (surface protein transpeptidase)
VVPRVVPGVVTGLVTASLWLVGSMTLDRDGGGPPAGPTIPPAEAALELAPPTPPDKLSAVHPGKPVVEHKPRQQPRPVHIRIPAIGVSARVVHLGLTPDGAMATPTNYSDTGWFAPGPEPGERGAAVIAGHVDNKTGPAVFFRLGQLRRGNSIYVTVAGGRRLRFTVAGLEHWPKANFPTKRVFGRTRAATLRLITCSGVFDHSTGHYLSDTIVYAVRGTAGST